MTHTGIATLVAPRDSNGVYELHLQQAPHNAPTAQAGNPQSHASRGNCVSYDTLISFLKEKAKSPSEDRLYIPNVGSIPVRDYAQGIVDHFEQNPAAANLAKEFMSNASCSDIASLTQSVIEGTRDLAIAQGANEVRQGLENSPLGRMFGFSGRAYGEVPGSGSYAPPLPSMKKMVSETAIGVATALVLVGGGFYLYNRIKKGP